MIDLEKYHLLIKDKKAQKLTFYCLHIGYAICLIGILILYCNNKHYLSPDFFIGSIIIFRNGLLMGVFSVICGIFFSNYEYLKN